MGRSGGQRPSSWRPIGTSAKGEGGDGTPNASGQRNTKRGMGRGPPLEALVGIREGERADPRQVERKERALSGVEGQKKPEGQCRSRMHGALMRSVRLTTPHKLRIEARSRKRT